MEPSRAIDFLRYAGLLKNVPRTGWVRRGIPDPESVAEHSFRVAVAALLLDDVRTRAAVADGAPERIDGARCMRMAMVHDLAEGLVGDLTPHDPTPKAEKHRLEAEAMARIAGCLGDHAAAEEVLALWREYEENRTVEAHFVKDLDKLEMCLQALEYESRSDVDLTEFFDSVRPRLQTAVARSWFHEVVARRSKRPEPLEHARNRGLVGAAPGWSGSSASSSASSATPTPPPAAPAAIHHLVATLQSMGLHLTSLPRPGAPARRRQTTVADDLAILDGSGTGDVEPSVPTLTPRPARRRSRSRTEGDGDAFAAPTQPARLGLGQGTGVESESESLAAALSGLRWAEDSGGEPAVRSRARILPSKEAVTSVIREQQALCLMLLSVVFTVFMVSWWIRSPGDLRFR